MKKRSNRMLPLLLLVAGGCGSAPSPPTAAPDGGMTATGAAQVGEGRYPLKPGDVVRLRIWREPDLSGEYPIDEQGVVVLPKIGAVQAAEQTPRALESSLRDEYSRYLRNPSIEIVLLRRINILGAVRAPGLYPVDPTMTLTDALALAGGVLAQGRQDRVEVFRGEHRLVSEVTGQTRVGDLGIRSGDQLYVPERHWASRNAGLIAGLASTILSVTASLIIAFKSR